jgi:endoglucanase
MATMRERHERDLLELTSLPTAAGCEERVIAWVRAWAGRRKSVKLRRDRYGNLMLSRPGVRTAGDPIVLAAHMDHPAFVVVGVHGRTITADFRGGVLDDYFVGSRVRVATSAATGVIAALDPATTDRPDKRVTVRFRGDPGAQPGEVMTWALPKATVRGGRLHAPACDDLAGVAAALAAFDRLGRSQRRGPASDVRVLLTRSEEVGFIGAIGACRSGILPRRSRIVALENSKSFAESPMGGGPIVRVGDRTSTFDPALTYAASRVAGALAAADRTFQWQRRLMPGGTCEATAYQALGFTATCLCLPLGNYHNMNEQRHRIDREVIALTDFHGLVRLLVELCHRLDADPEQASLPDRLDRLFTERASLLG